MSADTYKCKKCGDPVSLTGVYTWESMGLCYPCYSSEPEVVLREDTRRWFTCYKCGSAVYDRVRTVDEAPVCWTCFDAWNKEETPSETFTTELSAAGDSLPEIALRLAIQFWRQEGGDRFQSQSPRRQTEATIETAREFYLFLKQNTPERTES